MSSIENNSFQYVDDLSNDGCNDIPDALKLDECSQEALILRLLLGHIKLKRLYKEEFVEQNRNYFKLPYRDIQQLEYMLNRLYEKESVEQNRNYFKSLFEDIEKLDDILGRLYEELYEEEFVEQNRNYFKLPHRHNPKLDYKIFDDAMGIDNLREEEAKRICDKYFSINRKNSYVHERMLNEISWYFLKEKASPMESFVHLYRCLEFVSYSFPMIYASTATDYKGTYMNLKNFINKTGTGELKFFKNFLDSLFELDEETLEYDFEIPVLSPNLDKLKKEVTAIFMSGKLPFNFDNSTLRIKFKDMIDAFITVRNRYVHMSVGSGQCNVDGLGYDINDLFESLNPHLLNWLAVIFIKIVQHGYRQTLLYS